MEKGGYPGENAGHVGWIGGRDDCLEAIDADDAKAGFAGDCWWWRFVVAQWWAAVSRKSCMSSDAAMASDVSTRAARSASITRSSTPSALRVSR